MGIIVHPFLYKQKYHLGNIRLTYSDPNSDGSVTTSEIIEESKYYPFGMRHKVLNEVISSTNIAQKLKYNGKELQDELGINLYDYGARNYSPELGRWMNIDQLAEKFISMTPYNYCINNPILFIDPDGKEVITSFIYATDKNGKYKNPELVKAFNFFASSKEGIAFLADYVSEGQTIAGHKYEKAGKYDKKNIDIDFGLSSNKAADATTNKNLKDGNLKLTVGVSKGSLAHGYLADMGHELFIHVDLYAKDFSDDGILNSSSINKEIRNYVDENVKKGNYPKRWADNLKHHKQERKSKVLEQKLAPMLRDYYKKKNMIRTETDINRQTNGYMD